MMVHPCPERCSLATEIIRDDKPGLLSSEHHHQNDGD